MLDCFISGWQQWFISEFNGGCFRSDCSSDANKNINFRLQRVDNSECEKDDTGHHFLRDTPFDERTRPEVYAYTREPLFYLPWISDQWFAQTGGRLFAMRSISQKFVKINVSLFRGYGYTHIVTCWSYLYVDFFVRIIIVPRASKIWN